jgi:acetyl esterase
MPCLVWMHGGGFILGDARSDDAFCGRLAEAIGLVVMNVEYRLSPETPYPGALNDGYSVLAFVFENAGSLGIDIDRIGVGGRSAGGGLAAGMALIAAAHGDYHLAYQVLDMPELDDRVSTHSARAHRNAPNFCTENAILSWEHYLGHAFSRGGPGVPRFAAPARADVEDLQALPPTYLTTMELDPLRDEGILYGLNLLRAGVSVELHSYAGTFHGSHHFVEAPTSVRAQNDVETWLSHLLS